MKDAWPAGATSLTSTRSTRACGGPCRVHATSDSTALARALEDGVHGAVGLVRHPAGDPGGVGLRPAGVAEEHALHATVHHDRTGDLVLAHVTTVARASTRSHPSAATRSYGARPAARAARTDSHDRVAVRTRSSG